MILFTGLLRWFAFLMFALGLYLSITPIVDPNPSERKLGAFCCHLDGWVLNAIAAALRRREV